jgi:cob(I)alamin adenosyltransferase
MRIYTRKGDHGQTGILGGGRLSKSDSRIRALGALDETNAALGLVLSTPEVPEEIRRVVLRIQVALFHVGAALASLDMTTAAEFFESETLWLEEEIDRAEGAIPELTRFILPGGGQVGAGLHWARTLARRAENQVVAALEEEGEGGKPGAGRFPLAAWLNRLSDALFVLARLANHQEGVAETTWSPKGA